MKKATCIVALCAALLTTQFRFRCGHCGSTGIGAAGVLTGATGRRQRDPGCERALYD